MIYKSFRALRRWLFSDWQHVGILVQILNNADRVPHPHYIHLFENQYGDRKCTLTRPVSRYWVYNESRKTDSMVSQIPIGKIETGEVFQTQVYPWLNGATIDSIPAYNRVEKHKFVRSLQGKDPMVLNKEEGT